MKHSLLILTILLLISCQPEEKTASEIIGNAINYHGGVAYDTAKVEFGFRDKLYSLQLQNGLYTYQRLFTDSAGNEVVDRLSNEGFERLVNKQPSLLVPEDSAAFANSVNSVHYFALLPYGLNAPSVISEKLADAKIKGEDYYTIKVSFKQAGGGTDYEDEFIYWIDKDDYSMDYLAYKYHTEGGGVRFREAVNRRKINGIIFQDYNNYKAEKNANLETLSSQFANGELELLSEIDLNFTESAK